MEGLTSTFDEFSIEIGEYEVKKIKKFDRLWRIGEGGSVDQQPLVYKGRVYFGSMNHNVYCVDAMTGKLIWKFRTRDRVGVISSPIVYKNMIYIGSFDHFMYALDADTGELAWKFETRGEILSVACAAEGAVYFTSRDHNIYALTWDKGELLWKFRAQEEMQSSPTVFEDKVFFSSYDQNLYCADRRTGRISWKFHTQGELLNSPYFLIHNRVIHFGSLDGYLYAVNVDSGTLKWKRMMSNYGAMPVPDMNKGILYQCGRDGTLFALTLDGEFIWSFRKNIILGHPEVHEDRIYVTSEDKNFYCVSMEGKELWKFTTEGPVWWKPSFLGNIVYFGSYDCNLYAVDIRTRKLVWKFRCPGTPSYLPPLHDDFEVRLKIPKEVVSEEVGAKRYDVGIADEGESSDFYKSRITYQISTQYQSKGKYQIDSDEEEL